MNNTNTTSSTRSEAAKKAAATRARNKAINTEKPEEGKVYRLTGGKGVACIANGNTLKESEVDESNYRVCDAETGTCIASVNHVDLETTPSEEDLEAMLEAVIEEEFPGQTLSDLENANKEPLNVVVRISAAWATYIRTRPYEHSLAGFLRDAVNKGNSYAVTLRTHTQANFFLAMAKMDRLAAESAKHQNEFKGVADSATKAERLIAATIESNTQ